MIKKQSNIIYYLITVISTFILMLFFAFNTSPIYNLIGTDSGMFLVIGKELTQGKLLYSGIFDHKGPLIFIVNMLPQLIIKGTFGVFIFELIFNSLGSILLFKIATNHFKDCYKPLCLIPSILFIVFSVVFFNGGNYTEEYCNLFCIFSLYVFDKFMIFKKVSNLNAFLTGLSFACCFFFRPNNIALILSVVIFIIISLIKNELKLLRNIFIYGILGIFTITAPIFIYNLMVGTFNEMLYATIFHNISYCVANKNFRLFPQTQNSFEIIFIIIVYMINLSAIFCDFSSCNNKRAIFLCLSNIFLFIATSLSGYNYLYYHTLFAPLIAYSTISLLEFIFIKDKAKKSTENKQRKTNVIKFQDRINYKKKLRNSVITVLIISLSFCSLAFFSTNPQSKITYKNNLIKKGTQIIEKIPETERNNVFCYNMYADFIYSMNINPPFKYFTLQNWMSRTNPQITYDCLNFIKNSDTKYIIINSQTSFLKDEFTQFIQNNYTNIFENDSGTIYKIKK